MRRALRLRLVEALRPSDLQLTLIWAGIVGLCGALVSVAFRWLSQRVQELAFGVEGDLVAGAASVAPWERIVIPAVGGLAAGLVIRYGAHLAKGQPSTDYMEAVSLGDGTIRVRPSLVKSTASLLSVASGGSIGREGAMAQLSSMLASWIGRRRALPRPRLQLLVACGAAAGIASAYNVPIAGALFVAEIVLGTIAMESFGPLVFASVVSTLATRALLGGDPLFAIPQFELVSYVELGPYMVLGMLLGAIAPWFVRSLRDSEALFMAAVPTLPLRLAVGGAIVGIFSLYIPQVWGNGYSSIDAILGSKWLWQSVAMVLVCKFAATIATVGSGAVGGVFTPTLFVGAAFGVLFGELVHAQMPAHSASPSAYALVGMGSFLAGVTHAPLTAILMLFEMTRDYGIVLPLMLACVVAYYTARAIEPKSMYAPRLASQGPRATLARPEDATIRELVRPPPVTVRHDTPFAELVTHFVNHRHNYVYVVDNENRFLGAVSLHDIKGSMADPNLSRLVIASELMDPDFPFLELDSTVGNALDKLMQHYGERLPVVDGHGGRMLMGTLSKRDLLLTVGMRR